MQFVIDGTQLKLYCDLQRRQQCIEDSRNPGNDQGQKKISVLVELLLETEADIPATSST